MDLPRIYLAVLSSCPPKSWWGIAQTSKLFLLYCRLPLRMWRMGVKQKHAAQTAREDRITVNLKTTRGSTFTQTLCRLLTYSSRYSLDRQKFHILEDLRGQFDQMFLPI